MSNISEMVSLWIRRSPFIEEALDEGLINVSSLARKMQKEISIQLKMEVQIGAIVMAIQRRNPGPYKKVNNKLFKFFSSLGDLSVRSEISEFTYMNSKTLFFKQGKMLEELVKTSGVSFCAFSQGVAETTIILSDDLVDYQRKIMKSEKLLNTVSGLASVTIRMKEENMHISGIYYFILQRLAWAGINIVEVISTTCEFTLVIKEKDTDLCFSQLLKLKRDFSNK